MRTEENDSKGRPAALAEKDASAEERRAAAALMGRARTPKKIAAVLANLQARPPDKRGGKPPRPLLEIVCTCEAGDATEGHASSCLRGQAIKRRLALGRDVQTGYLPGEEPRGKRRKGAGESTAEAPA